MLTNGARPTPPLRIRIVVLNWNSAEHTRRCVRSLLATEYPPDAFEIVIVDNGSIDGSVPVLRRLFPTVRMVCNGANLGFAEGCNRAMRDLDGIDAVALVNNDATVEPGWLWPLVQTLVDDDSVGAASPKLLFATDFVTVAVDVGGSGDRVRLVAVHSGSLDLTAKTLPGNGVVSRPHLTTPLALDREIATAGEFHIPVDDDHDGTTGGSVTLRFATTRPLTATCGSSVASSTRNGHEVTLTVRADGPRHRRINNLGTGLTPWYEGVELRYGEADRSDLAPAEVPGWSGGGVLLRASYLHDVGVFEPRFFAYYEDTDLSWRGRRRGWRTMTAPTSVLHHVHGGSAGSSWPGFFFLNYRNWLLTALRNGGPTQILVALRIARRISWPYARHNVVGPLRRGRRPNWEITGRWVRVFAAVLAEAPRVLGSRRAVGPLGAGPDDHPVGRFQPPSNPRPPAPRPGGPTVCYVDVSETLRSGWRAGIQRVVSELMVRLATINDELEIVPICWSVLDRAYRRLDPAETELLFEPPVMNNHPPQSAPRPGLLRSVIGPLTRLGPLRTAKEGMRRRAALARQTPAERALVLERFEPGSVFFDMDATWNIVDADRFSLLAGLRAGGVSIVTLQHDLLPTTNPSWFDPNLVRVFNEHLGAHARFADLVLCNSRHTESELLAYCERSGLTAPSTQVVDFGADITPGSAPEAGTAVDHDDELFDHLQGRRVLLTVGTIEPRKNQEVLLEAFDRLSASHPDLTLVLVGRQGWHIDDFVARLRSHPMLGDRLQWPGSVSDATLDRLYELATLTVVPSFTEGFGLPVLEALGRRSVVLASEGGALPEAGGIHAEYFDASDVESLVIAIEAHLDDPAHHQLALDRVATFVAPSWDRTATQVSEAIRRIDHRRR